MWYYVINNIWKQKKLTSNKILKNYKWKKYKIKKIINMQKTNFLVNKYYANSTNFWVNILLQFYTTYSANSADLKKTQYTDFYTILILKLTKKQLFSSIMQYNKLLTFKSNGMFLKKLNIVEKSKKKDFKMYLINLKKIEEFFKKIKFNKKLLINLVNSTAILNRLSKSIKKIFKNFNNLFIYSPMISFSKKNFKKIKAIKRKLRKVYCVV